MTNEVSCFIRKNTPEIRKVLEEIGINYVRLSGELDTIDLQGTHVGIFVLGNNYFISMVNDFNSINAIDCGTNENFLYALAAQGRVSDYMKLFRYILPNGNKLFIQFLENTINQNIGDELFRYDGEATQEEIINHFKGKEKKTFYRVGNIETTQGLWYDMQGNFTGLIHSEYNFCMNNTLPMPFNKEVVGYLSTVDNLEDLFKWFSKEDIKKLEPFGYRVLIYESEDYKPFENHWLINQHSSNLIEVISIFNQGLKEIEKAITNSSWQDDLIMCPSQCYLYFNIEEKYYCIFLRWRWADPWTATLIVMDNRNTDIIDGKWIELDINDYSHDDLEDVKKEAITVVLEYFQSTQEK